jgi:hypothetical protein
MPRKGTTPNKDDATICMVVGCSRKALYRSTGRGASISRGYCRQHREFVTGWSELAKQRTEAWRDRHYKG